MLLEVTDIAKTFTSWQGWPVPRKVVVRALDGVTFHVDHGEALGVVGESGCGKSTAARAVLRLIPADRGSVRFDGEDVLAASPARMRALRRRMQIVFQDPASALDPRQRIGIARALVLAPDLIVADEPVSALDVSVQAQILLLLAELKKRRRLAFVFVSHDLGVVRHFCERTVVMYLGRIIESGPTGALFDAPKHPYTQLLRGASPVPDPDAPRAQLIPEGEPPSPVAPPPGCHFNPRCPHATSICRETAPLLRDLGGGSTVACHHAN